MGGAIVAAHMGRQAAIGREASPDFQGETCLPEMRR
jgi:hypothetical protein